MAIAFIRHGERRRGESDPELTSAGRRMAAETGRWLRQQGFAPARLICTPTARTRQTAEEISLVYGGLHTDERDDAPETRDDWQRLLDVLDRGATPVALVGHHPTMAFLLRAFGPPPVRVPVHHFAASVVLEPGGVAGWRISAAWPGRAA